MRNNQLNNSNSNSTGIAIFFLTVLQVVFIVLKATSSVDWPWWIIFLPTICSFLYVIVLFLIVLACVGIAEIIIRHDNKRKE